MTALLDANVLVALVVAQHVHHAVAESWLAATTDNFATCPITEGSLVRFLVREGYSATSAQQVLRQIGADARHEFWPDSIAFGDVQMAGVVSHRQVTDAYLAHLARARGARIATLDKGLAALHTDVAVLISA